MSKTVKIDFGSDRLISLAARLVDEHNYITALKMLNKNAVMSGNDEDSYMLYAEIFDDLGLYERSVHFWFKYLDVACFADLSDCYEGLAVGYMNLGNEHFSAYYYNKLLIETGETDDDMREQIVEDFLAPEENPLKFVYPPEIADVSDILADGVRLMKDGDFEKAQKTFEKVVKGNPKWRSARNYVAMCHIVEGRTEEAERECAAVLAEKPDDVQAFTTLAAVKTESGDRDAAISLTRKLLGLKTDDPDEIYKIATVCCENKLHFEAYGLFCKMEADFGCDLNVLYFKAVSAFNAGLYKECYAAFDKLLTLYPDAVTAEYYYMRAREMEEKGEKEELSYFYTLPMEIKKSSLALLAAFLKLKKPEAALIKEELNLISAIKWCFDNGDPTNSGDELKSLAAQVAIAAGEDDYVRDLLLNPFLSDMLKVEMLSALAERDKDNSFGVVICNVFRRVSMRKLNTGRKKHKFFVEAYARLLARFSILDDAYGEKLASAAEALYKELASAERLRAAEDVAALAVGIFIRAGIHDTGITKKNLYEFFEVTQEQMDKFRGNNENL